VLFEGGNVVCLGADELVGMKANLALHSGSPCSRFGCDVCGKDLGKMLFFSEFLERLKDMTSPNCKICKNTLRVTSILIMLARK